MAVLTWRDRSLINYCHDGGEVSDRPQSLFGHHSSDLLPKTRARRARVFLSTELAYSNWLSSPSAEAELACSHKSRMLNFLRLGERATSQPRRKAVLSQCVFKAGHVLEVAPQRLR